MKTTLTAFIFTLLGFSAAAQQNYFVYIQTENKQPFYVKTNDRMMSSSASGYVVIPKLTTGSYIITVGFPKDQWPQQSFPLTVGTTDAGYLLKDFGPKGWGLFNIQTMEVAMAGASAPVKTGSSGDDLFTNTLSGAANTNLKTENNPVVKAEPAVKTEPAAVKTEQPATNKTGTPVVNTGIEKVAATADGEGRSMIYVDKSASSNDTIRVFIPAAAAQVKVQPAEKETKFLDVQMQQPEVKPADAKPKTEQPSFQNASKPVVSFNSDCRSIATEEDFLKIRKRMAAETGDEAMIDAAKKFFKLKCYSTEQVKNLSVLFLSDSGRYGFFDAAYPHVNDTHNFSSLESQLHDEYYINRFKAMVKN